ncbi:MAG TPA: apolipoprotein N-acyltransferase [Micavibrio sp.]
MKWLVSIPDSLSLCSLKQRFMLAFVAGALCVLAMPPYGFWPILGLGLPVFFALLVTTRNVKTAFADAGFFALGYFGFGLSWVGNALLVDGNPYAWAWPLAVSGLPAILAMFYGVCGASIKFFTHQNRAAAWCAFVAGLSFTEWLRGHLFTGFPWNLYGYAWNDHLSIAQSVSLFGSYGLTALTIMLASLPALWWLQIGGRKMRGGVTAVTISLFIVLFMWGHARLAAHPVEFRSDVALKIVQPNIPQSDKWNGDKAADNFRKLMDLSQPETEAAPIPTIIIWPETAVVENAIQHPATLQYMRDTLQRYPRAAYLSTGILRSDTGPDGNTRYYNSLVTYDRQMNAITVYDKSHLVPFGEYMPLRQYIPLKALSGFEGFKAGGGPQTQAVDGLLKISPQICYEVIFPGASVARKAGVQALMTPDLIINVTNDGWYGDSAGPRQHLAMGRFRAIEEGIPLARSANTGISGLFDSYGRLIAYAPLNETKALNVTLPKIADTFYPIFGDLPFIFFVISILIAIIILNRRSL